MPPANYASIAARSPESEPSSGNVNSQKLLKADSKTSFTLQAFAPITPLLRYMPKKQLIGLVTSDRSDKSRRVEIPRLVKHPKYGKFLRRRTVCHAHDEDNASKLGDTVEIVECPPRSKKKRWELVRVVAESRQVDLAAMRAASKLVASEGEETAAGEAPPAGGSDAAVGDHQEHNTTTTSSDGGTEDPQHS